MSDYDRLVLYTIALIAIVLYLAVRALGRLESRLDALAIEFYRAPQLAAGEC